MKNGSGWLVQTGFTSVLLLLGISGWIFGEAVALGEEAITPITSRKTVELDTITVTAQKQEENVQDVPVSVTVIGDQEIEDQNIESIGELSDFVPNFMINNEGGLRHERAGHAGHLCQRDNPDRLQRSFY